MLRHSTSRTSRGGKTVGFFAGLFFVLIGFLFLALIGRETWQIVETFNWPRVPCTILESNITRDDSRDNYFLDVRYKYTFAGKEFESSNLERKRQGSREYAPLLKLQHFYRPEKTATCQVNPRDPSEAFLQQSSLSVAFALIIPVVFILIGGFIAFASITNGKPTSTPVESSDPEKSAGCLIAFFAIFFIAGLLVSTIFIRQLLKIVEARHWAQVPCEIISSDVVRHSGKNTTYSIDILFSYRVGDVEYRSNQHSFTVGSSSGYSGKQAIVRQFPPGRNTVCYVNPADPYEVVLKRGPTSTLWFALIPVTFMAVGLGGMFFAFRKRNQPDHPTRSIGPTDEFKERQLKPSLGRVGSFVFTLILAGFWNGIVFLVGKEATGIGSTRGIQWFPTLFLSIFALIGLALLWLPISAFLSLFSPRVHIRLHKSFHRPGETGTLRWSIEGERRFTQLTLTLVAREVQHRNSKNKITKDFYSADIFTTADARFMGSGSASIPIPEDARPSDNQVHWVLKLHGKLPKWPDVKEEFPLEVHR